MKRLILALVIGAVVVSVPALEVEEGRIRLVLDEGTSRFLLYLRPDNGDDGWIPLTFAEDPRTSGLDVREGNRVYRMGDSGDFRQVSEVTDEGVFYVWTSPTLRVSQRFRFIRSVGSPQVNGVQMEVAVTNLGEQTIPAAIRLLLDTYLGERGNAHFSTPLRDQITRETSIRPSASEWYVRSGAPEAVSGFQVILSADGVTTPEAVVVANWRRLSDSQWDYETNEDRNFNRLPYSINDSALLLTYPAADLRQNERYRVTMRMGEFAPNGYLDPDESAPMTADERAQVLLRLSELLARIDALLADPSATTEDVEALRAQLQQLAGQVPGQ